MNIAIYIAIIACTTYIGFGFADYYNRRAKLFYELTSLCERLKTDISFLLMPLAEILSNVEKQYSSMLLNIVSVISDEIKKGNILSAANLSEKIKSKYINDEEQRLICSFFAILGKSDAKTQIENIENYQQRFAELEKLCTVESKKFSPMCKKLGFLFGIALCLFML